MAKETDILFTIKADTADLRKQLAAAKKGFRKLSDEADAFGDKAGKAGKKAGKTTTSLERLGAGAQATGGRMGEMVERVANANKAMGALGPVALLTTVIITGVATAAIGLTVAAFAVVGAAKEMADTLGDLSGASDVQREALDDASGAMDASTLAAKRLTIQIGAELAPGVEKLTDLITKLELAALDLADSGLGKLSIQVIKLTLDLTGLTQWFEFLDAATADYDDTLKELKRDADAVALALSKVTLAIKSQGAAGKEAEAALADLAAAELELASLGLEGIELIEARSAASEKSHSATIRRLEREAEQTISGSAEAEAADAKLAAAFKRQELDRTKFTLEGSEARTKIAEDAHDRELARLKERLSVEQKIIAEALAANEKRFAAEQEQRESLEVANVAQAEFQAERIRAESVLFQEAHQDELERIAERGKANIGLALMVSSAAEVGFGTIAKMLANVDGAFKATRAAAVAFFIASKLSSLSQVTINTAVAITKALADLGPIAGAVAATAIGVTGAAQGVTIAAQSPPKFRFGGVVPESAPSFPGADSRERAVIADVGEEFRQPGGGQTIRLIADFGGRQMEIPLRQSREDGVLREIEEPATLGQRRFMRAR